MAKVWIPAYTKDDGTKVKWHYREKGAPRDVSAIYGATHSDYKSQGRGVKRVMYLDNGVTTSGPIRSMPDDVYVKKLLSVLKRPRKK